MSIESRKDLDGLSSQRIYTRRQVLLGGLALSLAACAPSTSGQSERRDDSKPVVNQPQNSPEQLPTQTEQKPNGPRQITTGMTEFVYADQITSEEWKNIAEGAGIPLPFGLKAFPLTAESVTRRIRATNTAYGKWVGRELADQILAFLLPDDAELVAFADGQAVLQPGNNDAHSANTTRIEFHIPGANRAYVYRIGGKENIEWLTEIPVFPAKYLPVKAGQPLARIIKPAKVPAQVLPDITANIPSIYHLWLTQQTVGEGNTLESIYREEADTVTSSQLNLSSLMVKNGKYIGLYQQIGK